MIELVSLALQFGLLLVAYFGVDRLLRGEKLTRLLDRCRLRGEIALIFVACVLGGALAFFSRSWQQPLALRAFGSGVALVLSYNAATRDYDPTILEKKLASRWSVVAFSLLGFVQPGALFVVAAVLSCNLRFWLHHATLPMRVLQALVAYLVASALPLPVSVGPFSVAVEQGSFVAFILMMIVSHYFITALAKALLGRHPLSWVIENRLHYLVASAYSWGWARFVPWPRFRRLVHGVKRVEIPLQAIAFALELSIPLSLLSPKLAQGFLVVVALFHLGVFTMAGLLFWDWIAIDLLAAGLIWALPPEQQSMVANPAVLCVGLVVMALFPLRHKLWQPMPLAWFDTPLTARIVWEVRGQSGRWYGLYNDFMCPYERLYGRVHGCFFVPHPVVTYHLGEVWKPAVRDAIVEAGPDRQRLSRVREQYGVLPNSPTWRQRHINFLQAFFARLNAGAQKSALPNWARFLKAPGDQIFYWGRLPSYRRNEPVDSVRLRFVEEYFDETDFVSIYDEVVAEFEIPEVAPQAIPEPTPKELDAYLLRLAAGRLIDLPASRKKYSSSLESA